MDARACGRTARPGTTSPVELFRGAKGPAAQPVLGLISPSARWARPSLLVAPDLELLADLRPDKFDRAAVRWHGRLELETPTLTVAESQLALAALGALRGGERDAADVLRKLLRRVRPTLLPRVS